MCVCIYISVIYVIYMHVDIYILNEKIVYSNTLFLLKEVMWIYYFVCNRYYNVSCYSDGAID